MKTEKKTDFFRLMKNLKTLVDRKEKKEKKIDSGFYGWLVSSKQILCFLPYTTNKLIILLLVVNIR